MSDEKYRKLTPVEHVLERTHIYAGSTEPYEAVEYVWNGSAMVLKNVSKNDALVKILNEMIDNAVDNQSRGIGGTALKITMSSTSFTASNDGQHISITKHSSGDLIPTMLFETLNCGSNFCDDTEDGRTSIGANGVGVVLTNIMSTAFNITILDPDQGLCLRQSWMKNMSIKTEPILTKKKSTSKSMVTTVSCTPDLARFKMSSLDPILPQIHTRLLQLAAITTLKVTFNGTLLKNNTFKKYIQSFQDVDKFLYAEVNPTLTYGLALSDGQFRQQSFVNAQPTTAGGTHVNVVVTQILDTLIGHFKKKFKGVKLNRHQLKQRLFVFANVSNLRNPGFKSQQKCFLTNPFSKTEFAINDKRVLAVAKSSGLLDQLEAMLKSKEADALNAMSGRKKRTVSIPKYDSAHDSGTTRSNGCILYLTEGDSAATMVRTGMSVVGRRQTGCFPLRGKILNVRGASALQISDNAEIQAVIKILGLSFSRRYVTDADLDTLRYGKVCILCDQDSDGAHVSGAPLRRATFRRLTQPSRLFNRLRHFFCPSSTTTGQRWWSEGTCSGSSHRS